MKAELGNTPANKNYKPSGISKAEEQASRLYPYENGVKGLICENSRQLFIQGYEQAEKDLAMTIDDLELLHTFLYAVKNNKQGCFTFTRLSDEQYQEVLRRFNNAKQR